MDLNVVIDAEAINREITEAIAKSAIGKSLTEEIERAVKRISESGYNSPIRSIIEREIAQIITTTLREEPFQSQLKSAIQNKLNDALVESVTSAAFNALLEKL